jgi:hypothetical protein
LRGNALCRTIGGMANNASSIYSRALQRAAELLGGRDKLAKYLDADSADVQKWISGAVRPPQGIFLRVVDFIIDETSPAQGDDGAGEAPSQSDCAPAQRCC